MDRVDMMQTLAGFSEAYRSGIVETEPVLGNKSVLRHQDHPVGGTPRMTYAQLTGADITAVAVFCIADPYEGLPCIQIGYAVSEDARGAGVAKKLTKVALSDFTNFLKNQKFPKFVIESTVDRDNPASKAVTMNLLSINPEEKDDRGVPVWHFIKIIEV